MAALPRTRFVIACFARSGTHLLESSLNQHPDITCYWEPFNSFYYQPEETAAERLTKIWSREGVVGFPAHFEWQGRREWTDLWDILRRMPDLHVIQLHRRNLLRQYVSKQLLDITKVHQLAAGDAAADRPSLAVDVRDMLTYMFIVETSMHAKHRWFSEQPTLYTTYEQLTGDADGELRRVQEFLGVSPCALVPRTQRQETRPLSEVIENYDNVALALRRSGWAHFLDESADVAHG